ncbi:hypothetical protein [Streptomyces flaveus]|uniref:Uncharacterized protein n=1 Tax=Streptomyces flaveus TaxID=66370 RepID=A0A917QEE4_9ACTN|nr:hypothetical protein [Streptomyces flaveus]GGK46472.1 hypothetical protein GCM10010094_03060 [Streptomyces flaveus]
MKEPPHAPEGPPAAPEKSQPRRKRTRPLTVQSQFLAMEGADGGVLQCYQIQAIRAALRWLVEHPDIGTQ